MSRAALLLREKQVSLQYPNARENFDMRMFGTENHTLN